MVLSSCLTEIYIYPPLKIGRWKSLHIQLLVSIGENHLRWGKTTEKYRYFPGQFTLPNAVTIVMCLFSVLQSLVKDIWENIWKKNLVLRTKLSPCLSVFLISQAVFVCHFQALSVGTSNHKRFVKISVILMIWLGLDNIVLAE